MGLIFRMIAKRLGQGWIRTSEGVEPADLQYASGMLANQLFKPLSAEKHLICVNAVSNVRGYGSTQRT
jgi:hypothetical protein